jgi:hypothetical protein
MQDAVGCFCSPFSLSRFGSLTIVYLHQGSILRPQFLLSTISFPQESCNVKTIYLLHYQPCFPTMNPRELVDHIRSGPVELLLDEPLPRFRRRTRSNPCDFNEFLQALRSSETIRNVRCCSQMQLGITEDEWVLLVKTIGIIKCIDDLSLWCEAGSRDFNPFQAIAEAVNSAHSLRELAIDLEGESLPRDPSGLTALSNALKEHASLQGIIWVDHRSRLESTHLTALDPVLRALPTCRHLWRVTIMTKCASAGAIKNLLQLQSATYLCLILDTDQWLAVVDEVRLGLCLIKNLRLGMLRSSSSEATEAIKALARAIKVDRDLEHITLQMEDGFTDEAGVALAEALTVNKTLRGIILAVDYFPYQAHRATLGTPAYEAFSTMLRVNTSLLLDLPLFESADKRLADSHNQMVIEQRLNKVGRGRLLTPSNQTTREEWVDALYDLNSCNANDPPACRVSCMYSLLRLNPSGVCLS